MRRGTGRRGEEEDLKREKNWREQDSQMEEGER